MPRRQLGAGSRQLAAGSQDRHDRAAPHAEFRHIGRGDQRNLARAEAPTGLEHRLSSLEIKPLAADMAAGGGAFFDPHPAFRTGGRMFLDDDGIGPIGYRAAGKDAQRLTLLEEARKRCPGRRFADEPQLERRCGHIGRPDRIAVHGREIVRRLGTSRHDRIGEHAAQSLGQGHAFSAERLRGAQDAPQSIRDGDHKESL